MEAQFSQDPKPWMHGGCIHLIFPIGAKIKTDQLRIKLPDVCDISKTKDVIRRETIYMPHDENTGACCCFLISFHINGSSTKCEL